MPSGRWGKSEALFVRCDFEWERRGRPYKNDGRYVSFKSHSDGSQMEEETTETALGGHFEIIYTVKCILFRIAIIHQPHLLCQSKIKS